MKPRQQKRRKYLDPGMVILLRQVFWGVLVFISIALLITALWYITRIPGLTIQTVTVEGGVTIDDKLIEERVNEALLGTYFKLVPKRFIYTYPKEAVLANVRGIERMKEVTLEEVSTSELRITFSEYIPDTLWCDTKDESSCYFFDENGYAFAAAPSLSGESVVRYFSAENEFTLGRAPFAKDDYTLTREFTRLLSGVGWFVTKIEINAARDVFYTLAKGGEIKATLNEPALPPFENLLTIRNSEEFSHLTPGNFKYIDLRFGARVFVNEEWQIETATSTATTSGEVELEAVGSPD